MPKAIQIQNAIKGRFYVDIARYVVLLGSTYGRFCSKIWEHMHNLGQIMCIMKKVMSALRQWGRHA